MTEFLTRNKVALYRIASGGQEGLTRMKNSAQQSLQSIKRNSENKSYRARVIEI